MVALLVVCKSAEVTEEDVYRMLWVVFSKGKCRLRYRLYAGESKALQEWVMDGLQADKTIRYSL